MTKGMILRAAVPLLLLAPALAGCAGDDGPVTLEVTTQDWTGWSREQPEPTTQSVTLTEGESFTVTMLGDEVTVTLTGVDDDGVELETSRQLARKDPGGGADHDDLTDEFTLDRDGSVAFTTPSLDGGTTVTVAEG
ncbi:hypothetical protein BJ993_003581 [Nocardioides aromaticivorans]|uniref:Lipoprotein n=1 Tax=Nocardioides aromaticivorans TaxID=200618 RepID=A0A7Z0CM69_9ACTN|nr:hypothetical protein [Nocardioides aromaticivorans]NYI46501.1 hypothetical protein [Nocardioides aromaticivorans]